MKDSHRALAISCWFKVPYATVLAMPSTYAERLYEAIPVEHRPPEDSQDAQFTLNDAPITFDDLRIFMRGYFGPRVAL